MGLDYVSVSKGGTIIIYDDTAESLAKSSIEILKNNNYKKNLSIEGRKSMKQFNNKSILDKWIKIILSIYNDNDYFIKIMMQKNYITYNEAKNIFKTNVGRN